MKLDGNAVLYQLSREFETVTCDTPLRSISVDYPILYDESINMSGHVVMVPDHERAQLNENMQQVLCVCLGDASAQAAKDGGLCVAHIHDDVTFQQVYNRMQSIYVLNERLDAQLRAYVDTAADYQQLLDACAKTMGFDCLLMDKQFRFVCKSECEPNAERESEETLVSEILEGDAVDLFMASKLYAKTRGGRKVFAMPGANNLFIRNIFWGDRLVGMLAMKHLGDMRSARYVRFLLNYLAPFVEDMYERVGAIDLAQSRPTRIRAALKSAIAGTSEGAMLLGRLLADEGFNPTGHFEIMRIERSFTRESAESLGYFSQRFERAWPHAYCVEAEGKLYALTGIDAPDEFGGERGKSMTIAPQELPAILRDNLAKAGISRPFSDMREIPAARVQADAALAQGSEVDPAFWLYRFDDYALGWIAQHGCGSAPAEYVCHSAIMNLMHHDEAHGSDLVHTLSTYMENRYNAVLAAQKLFVARSTLINRLERIVELTGINLDDFDERIYLALSLKLLDRTR